MKREIEHLLVDYEARHSEFQIEHFIIGSAVDPWSKYKQALREIHDRNEMLIEKQDQLMLFDLKFRFYNPFSRKAVIKKEIARRQRKAMVDGMLETKRELSKFVEIAIKLKSEIGELDSLKRAVLEAESWRQKAIKMAGIDLLVNGRVGSTTLNFILSLPKADQAMVIEHFKPGAKVDPFKMIGL